jgi:flagellar hook-associated protein 2
MSISVGGLTSGLDTNSIIDQLLALQQEPILRLQQREADYQVELSAYGSLQSALTSLQSAIEDLDSVSDFTRFSATSGDTDLFTASANENATAGSYNIKVQQLARAHKLKSAAFGDIESVGEGTIHLKVGGGDTVDITVSATDTIQDVAEAINDADVGVQAAVIFDGTNYFLTLAAHETGAENVINLTVTDTGDSNNTDMNGLSRLVYDQGVTENFSQTQAASDSIITVDGVADIHRGKNTIGDVIQGVSITLKSENLWPWPVGTATLTVSRDTSAVFSKIDAFVSAYNEVLDLLDTYQGYDPDTKTAGTLLGDATTNRIRNRLRNLITDMIPGVAEGYNRLSDLGVTVNEEGHLEVDSSKVHEALDDHFDEVVQFFTQTTGGSEGFVVRMADAIDAILDSRDGAIAAREGGIQNSIDDIQDQIERLEMRISAWERRTRSRFESLELLLTQYQTTWGYLSQQILGLQNLNNYISMRG